MPPTRLLKRADELLVMDNAVLSTAYSTGGQYNISCVKSAPKVGRRSAALSLKYRTFGDDLPHSKQFSMNAGMDFRTDAEEGIAIQQAIRDEIAASWLSTITEPVAAELFADFLSIAEHLLEAGTSIRPQSWWALFWRSTSDSCTQRTA